MSKSLVMILYFLQKYNFFLLHYVVFGLFIVFYDTCYALSGKYEYLCTCITILIYKTRKNELQKF